MKHFLTAALAASVVCLGAVAHAQEAFTAGKPQVGVTLGYGIYTGDDLGGDTNPYGLGFGVRGGYTLDMNVHVGASFEYFLGASKDVPGGSYSVNVWNMMLEPGYDLGVGENMVLRPQLGLGMSHVKAEGCVTLPPPIGTGSETCNDNGDTKFALAPGAMFLMDFGGIYGMGGLRYHHIFLDNGNADALLINIGAGMTF